MQRGFAVGGWVVGFITAVGAFITLVVVLAKLAMFAAGEDKDD